MLKFAAIILSLVAVPALANEPDYDAVAKKIDADSAAIHQNDNQPKANVKQPKADTCEGERGFDGKCPPVIDDTRQFLKGGAQSSVNKSAARAAVIVTPSIFKLTFLLGSAELSASAKAQLDKFAASLVKLKSMSPFSIDGHTDRSGSAALNMNLSRERAQSVLDYLAAHGVSRSRMTARGFGYSQPRQGFAPDSPENRRVEVIAR